MTPGWRPELRLLGVLATVALTGCSPMVEPSTHVLSRLVIDNRLESAEYLRATWRDGLEQVAEIPSGAPLYFSGSIAGAFPATVEVLDGDCEVIDRMTGMRHDVQARLVITDQALALEEVSRADPSWKVAMTTEDCRTKPPPP